MKLIILDILGKFLKERKQVEENIESLKQKIEILTSTEKKEITNQEVKEKTKNFLKADYINKEILFDIVHRKLPFFVFLLYRIHFYQ